MNFNSHRTYIILLLILIIPAIKETIKPGYFRMHDDLQFARQIVMDKCFRDLQIPCRWSEDLGYGYGYPIFNYYPPLPYYIGQPIRALGVQYIDVFKVLVVIHFAISALGMYLLAQKFWGKKGGFLSALFFVYGPYHATDIYARAAVNEAWALSFFPLVFWAVYKLIETNMWKFVPLLALFSALIMLSHNPLLMIFTPAAILWTSYWFFVKKAYSCLPKLIVSAIWALGLAAFFTLPVLAEQKYAHVDSLVSGYFNYLAHYADLFQLFLSDNWGYGESRLGSIDEIGFNVGYLHWLLTFVMFFVAVIKFKRDKQLSVLIILVGLLTLGFTFMIHQKSTPIWQAIKPLEYLQFPWRFLTVTTFLTSFLAGGIVLLLKNRVVSNFKNLFIIFLAFAIIWINKDYFRWVEYYPQVNDQIKMSGENWRLQITSGIFDYLPIWAPLPPVKPAVVQGEVIEGEGSSKLIFKNSLKQVYEVNMQTEGVFKINTLFFPGFIYLVDQRLIDIDPQKDLDKEFGTPLIKLNQGHHLVEAVLTDTAVRKMGNIGSLVSWTFLLGFGGWFLKRLSSKF